MFDTKRFLIVGSGVLAFAATAVVTAAAGPPRPLSAGPLPASHEPVVALVASSTSQTAAASSQGVVQLAPALPTVAKSDAGTSPASTATVPSAAAPAANTPTQLIHPLGRFISALAHAISGGPDHGKLISFFATSLNSGHVFHARGHDGPGQ